MFYYVKCCRVHKCELRPETVGRMGRCGLCRTVPAVSATRAEYLAQEPLTWDTIRKAKKR
jgi:hypothetical protein